jgi:hypothetical protein
LFGDCETAARRCSCGDDERELPDDLSLDALFACGGLRIHVNHTVISKPVFTEIERQPLKTLFIQKANDKRVMISGD